MRPLASQVFDGKGKIVGFFGLKGTYPGSMDLPAGLCIVDSDLDLFQQYLHPAFDAKQLVVVSNQFGPSKISVYAVGQLKPGKTVADVSRWPEQYQAPGWSRPTHDRRQARPITIGTPLPDATFAPPASMPAVVSPGEE